MRSSGHEAYPLILCQNWAGRPGGQLSSDNESLQSGELGEGKQGSRCKLSCKVPLSWDCKRRVKASSYPTRIHWVSQHRVTRDGRRNLSIAHHLLQNSSMSAATYQVFVKCLLCARSFVSSCTSTGFLTEEGAVSQALSHILVGGNQQPPKAGGCQSRLQSATQQHRLISGLRQ